MTPQEARNLIPGDLIDYVTGPDYDTGYVKEVRASKTATSVLVRSTTPGWGTELVSASRVITLVRSATAKPTPTLKACRDMTRGYIP